jgi:hypothetical protein
VREITAATHINTIILQPPCQSSINDEIREDGYSTIKILGLALKGGKE